MCDCAQVSRIHNMASRILRAGFVAGLCRELRNECFNAHQVLSTDDARSRTEAWR